MALQEIKVSFDFEAYVNADKDTIESWKKNVQRILNDAFKYVSNGANPTVRRVTIRGVPLE